MVESIPEGLDFNSSTSHPSIFQAWLNLMSEARSSVDIASFYWTLTNEDTGTQEPTARQVSWGWSLNSATDLPFFCDVTTVHVCRVRRGRPSCSRWWSFQASCPFALRSTSHRGVSQWTTSNCSTNQVPLFYMYCSLLCSFTLTPCIFLRSQSGCI